MCGGKKSMVKKRDASFLGSLTSSLHNMTKSADCRRPTGLVFFGGSIPIQ